MDLSIIKKDIENLQKQGETMFNSETMKIVYNNYLDKLKKNCNKIEELNKIFSNIREEQKSSQVEIVQTDDINLTIDINRISDQTIRNSYEKFLKYKELYNEDINTKSSHIEILDNLEIKVIDQVEQLCKKIINDVMYDDYIDYSSIIDMIELISSNIPRISKYMNILTTLKTLLDVNNKLNNDTQKYNTFTNIDKELFKIEEKIKVLTIFTEYLESIIEIFNKKIFIASPRC